jgi:hypothetical protein
MSIDPALHVERFRCQYLIPADHPSPEGVRARLDSAIQKGLPYNLAALLDRLAPASDPGIWLIRKVEVDLSVNMTWEFERMAEQWAFSIARKLAYILQGDGGDPDALYFPDRPAYLARFMLDLVKGSAWGCWYYTAFEGLRLLPLSAVLRTTVCEDPSTGIRALLRMDAASTVQVVQSMNASDARSVLAIFLGKESSGLSVPEPREGLLHYVEALRGLTGQGGGAASIEELRRSVEMSDWTAAYLQSADQRAEAGKISSSARRNDPAVKEQLRPLGGDRAQTTTGMEARFTPFGGGFFRLPMLASLKLDEIAGAWPAAGEASAGIALRFTLLLKCLGQANARRAARDNLLRDLLAVPPALDEGILKNWQLKLSPEQLRGLLSAVREAYRAPREPEQREWLLLRLPRPGRPVALLLDKNLGRWRFAVGISSNGRSGLAEQLSSWLSALAPEDIVFCESSLHPFVPSEWKGEQIMLLNCDLSRGAQVSAGGPSSESEFPIHLDQLRTDLDYLTLPTEMRGPSRVDLALSMAAQNLLRAFAQRLPGFSHSGLPYLYANFLHFPASLRDEGERWLVGLGQPPLALILNITGLARATYCLGWLDGRPFALHPEE